MTDIILKFIENNQALSIALFILFTGVFLGVFTATLQVFADYLDKLRDR